MQISSWFVWQSHQQVKPHLVVSVELCCAVRRQDSALLHEQHQLYRNIRLVALCCAVKRYHLAAEGAASVLYRISDQGGGIPDSEVLKVWQYGYTTISQEQPVGMIGAGDADPIWSMSTAGEAGRQYKMGGLGFGLPMSRLYARYFGTMDD